ncbi:hypothetical protein [Rhodoblastus sp.]|uniref:hypothetical protein n=1 Tax=Rhodoblastus sp. TaxID=1962975 RepID=UPI003F986A1C
MKIDAATVAELLKKAKAPKELPLEELEGLAEALRSIVFFEQSMKVARFPRTPMDRALAAFKELRREIPKIAEIDRQAAKWAPEDAAAALIAHADQIESWLAAAPEFYDSRRGVIGARRWPGHAELIYDFYHRRFGGGVSKTGPAVRFVKVCFDFLKIEDCGMITEVAVEKVLRKANSAK